MVSQFEKQSSGMFSMEVFYMIDNWITIGEFSVIFYDNPIDSENYKCGNQFQLSLIIKIKILCDIQYGFRPNHSTNDAITELW